MLRRLRHDSLGKEIALNVEAQARISRTASSFHRPVASSEVEVHQDTSE